MGIKEEHKIYFKENGPFAKKRYIFWICEMEFHLHDESFTLLWESFKNLGHFSQEKIKKEINRDNPVPFEEFKMRLIEYNQERTLRRAQSILMFKLYEDKRDYYRLHGAIKGVSTLDHKGQFGLDFDSAD